LFIQYRENTGNIQAKNHYKTHCSILRKIIKEAKKHFFHKQIATSSNKIKTTWRIITDNSGNTKHTDIIDSMKCGNVLLNNPKDIANAFNNYYTIITSSLNIKHNNTGTALLLLNNLKLDNIVQMEITPVSEIEVVDIINCLKPKDSAGYDGISTKILKHYAHLISKPLTFIFNSSLMSGICPERCKLAVIRPIYKKGRSDDLNNYRPISLLTAISNILETIMLIRLVQHLDKNKILTSVQFGFWKDAHINDAIFSLLNNI
jgi:hypothetical protein